MVTTTVGSTSRVHAALPLALFEAMRELDVPAAAGLDQFHQELATKRLGTSPTVAAQIDRYRRLAEREARVGADEVIALFKLVGRRSDASQVFSDAGRRAAEHAVALMSPVARLGQRLLPRGLGARLGFRLARRAAQRVLDISLAREGQRVVAQATNPPTAAATPDGTACALFESAVAALLRTFTAFDGAVVHPACRTRAAPACRWETATAREP